MKQLNILIPAAVLTLAGPVAAQQGPMPTTEVTPDAYVTALGGSRIRTLYNGIGQDFLFELQDRDVGDLFSYGLAPEDRTIAASDLIVVVLEDWAEAYDFWNGVGIPAMAGNMAPYRSMTGAGAPVVVLSEIGSPEGHTIRVYTFIRTVMGEPQDERCMARRVIDETYRGAGRSDFNSYLCSQDLR